MTTKTTIVRDAIVVTTRAERQAAREEAARKLGTNVGAFTYDVYRVGKEAVHLTAVAGSGVVSGFNEARAKDVEAMLQLSNKS